jgi:phosphoglycolate phosphatase
MSRYSTVIFDLDGTLIDTKRGILSCLEHTFNTLGLPQYPEPDRFLGPPLPDSFRRFCGMSESETDEAVRIFRERYSGEELFNAEAFRGIPELLGELKDNGYTLAVATCKVEKYAVSILAHFGIDKYFDAVAAPSPRGRRSVRSLLMCLKRSVFPTPQGCSWSGTGTMMLSAQGSAV